MVPMNRVRGQCVGRGSLHTPLRVVLSDGALRLPKLQFTYYIIGILLLPQITLLCGCARNTEGMRILEDLRADGLLHHDSDEPWPQLQHTEMQRSWLFPAEGELSLSHLLEAADHLNPRIAAARAGIGTAGGRAWQASFYPNPTFELESENVKTSGGGFGDSQSTISINQPIIIGGRLKAAVAVAEAEMNVKQWELQQVRLQVYGRISRKVTEIIYYQQAISLHEELRLLAQRTLEISQTRFEARAAPEAEAIRSRVEVNSLGLVIERLGGDMAAAGERLDSLLGGQHIDLKRVSGDMLVAALAAEQLPALDQLVESIRTTHPTVLVSKANIDAAKRQVELQRALSHSDITARFGVGVNHIDDEGFIEAGIGIPLPIFDQNQGNILAARFEVIRAEQEAKAISNELTGTLGEAYRKWESASARLAVFQEQILAGAQRYYDQTITGYEAGKLPFLALLDAQRTLIESNVAKIDLSRSVSLILTEIYEILGQYPHPENEKGTKP